VLSKYLSVVVTFARHPGQGVYLLRERITSPLYIKSFYLMGGVAVSALFGFLFWMLAARWATAAAIGLTSAALSSSNLLIALCELGLGTALVYYAGANPSRVVALVNCVVGAGWMTISAALLVFLLGMPIWSPGLLSIRDSALLVLVYVGFTPLNHILALQDAAMLSQGQAQYVFWRTLACNIPSVALLLPLVALLGAQHGLMLAYFLPNIAVGLFASLFVLPRQFPGYRFFGRLDRDVLGQVALYGSSNHVSNLFWGLPAYLLPLVAVNTLTPAETGHFAISWTIANFVLIAPRMISFALFAEAAQNRNSLRAETAQAMLLILAIVAPLVLVLWLAGEHILGFFGREYVQLSLLRLLLLSVVPFSINSVFFVVLRVHGRLKQQLLFTSSTALAILGSTLILVPSLRANGLAAGWLVGHTLAGVWVAVSIGRFGSMRRYSRKAEL
jgi:O-antigen/teichoic acid export membrane protein